MPSKVAVQMGLCSSMIGVSAAIIIAVLLRVPAEMGVVALSALGAMLVASEMR